MLLGHVSLVLYWPVALLTQQRQYPAVVLPPDKLLRFFGNGSVIEIPEDLVEGYGYPRLTKQAKRKILSENLLRLQGMNLEETRRQFANA